MDQLPPDSMLITQISDALVSHCGSYRKYMVVPSGNGSSRLKLHRQKDKHFPPFDNSLFISNVLLSDPLSIFTYGIRSGPSCIRPRCMPPARYRFFFSNSLIVAVQIAPKVKKKSCGFQVFGILIYARRGSPLLSSLALWSIEAAI